MYVTDAATVLPSVEEDGIFSRHIWP